MPTPVGPMEARQPIPPIQAPAPRRAEEENARSLEQERDALENQLLLLKGTSDAATTPEVEQALRQRLEEVNRRLQTAAPAPPRFDRYEPGGDGPEPSAGLYRIEADESGAPSVVFDAPAEEPDDSPAAPKEAPERTTTNTDRVDRELRRLEESCARLRQELHSARGGADEDALRRELSRLEAELAQKDNDTYRRQHASVTEE